MITWTKPNGNEIQTNDLPATVAQAEKLKWKRVKKKAVVVPQKIKG